MEYWSWSTFAFCLIALIARGSGRDGFRDFLYPLRLWARGSRRRENLVGLTVLAALAAIGLLFWSVR